MLNNMTKTLTEKYMGNVPVGISYKLIDISYSSRDLGSFTTCDNCGLVISNQYFIESEDGKKYVVGSECVNAIINNSLELSEAKRKLARRARFYKMLKSQAKCIVKNEDTFWAYKSQVDKWNSFFIGRGMWSSWQKEIEFLKLPIIEYTE